MKREYRARIAVYSLAVVTTLLLTGCASTAAGVTKGVLDKVFETKPPTLHATLEASPELNPDYEGHPSPLVLRFYELTDVTEFNAAQFFTLYEEDEELLGSDLKGREEMVILPGESRAMDKELKMETRYFGVFGAYRDIEKAIWRAYVETPVNEKTVVTIHFGKLSVSIIPKQE